MENILDDMSHTPQSHAPANENESVPRNSNHPKKKRRTKDKTFENMSSNMGAMAESISVMVPKLDGLISVLSTTDKELSDLQAKLYGEICKIEVLGEQEILDAIDILATKHNMLRVFFNLPNELKKGYILQKIGRGIESTRMAREQIEPPKLATGKPLEKIEKLFAKMAYSSRHQN
ncbi:hypothetical protein WN944_001678 [Citrus x changshan-huyou]|uniref:Uncharacterized protein n=1 Tax=Citrus x changshan-huyou TaxID=2935761 RepID=A0AAP0MJU8_9ROSI